MLKQSSKLLGLYTLWFHLTLNRNLQWKADLLASTAILSLFLFFKFLLFSISSSGVSSLGLRVCFPSLYPGSQGMLSSRSWSSDTHTMANSPSYGWKWSICQYNGLLRNVHRLLFCQRDVHFRVMIYYYLFSKPGSMKNVVFAALIETPLPIKFEFDSITSLSQP